MRLETPPNALKRRQRLGHRSVGEIERQRDADGRQCVQYVVASGQVQHHFQVWPRRCDAPLQREHHLATGRTHVHGADLCVLGKPIGDDLKRQLRGDPAQRRVVDTQDGATVERHTLQELHKGGLQALEIMSIGLHVVGVDVRHHRHDRQQVQEGGV